MEIFVVCMGRLYGVIKTPYTAIRVRCKILNVVWWGGGDFLIERFEVLSNALLRMQFSCSRTA